MPEKPELKLIGEDGNVFAIFGRARIVYRKNLNAFDKSWEEILEEAKSGDYDNVLQVMMKYFEVS